MTRTIRVVLVFLVVFLASSAAKAELVFTLENPAQDGNPGDTIPFRAFLKNTGFNAEDQTGFDSLYLNQVGNTLAQPGEPPYEPAYPLTFSVSDETFLSFPYPMGRGGIWELAVLFSVTIGTDVPLGTYAGTVEILGGPLGQPEGENDPPASSDLLATAHFQVNVTAASVVPEPFSMAFMASALVGVVGLRARQRRADVKKHSAR